MSTDLNHKGGFLVNHLDGNVSDNEGSERLDVGNVCGDALHHSYGCVHAIAQLVNQLIDEV